MTLLSIANSSNLDAARIGFHAAFLEMLGLVDKNELDLLYMHVTTQNAVEEWDWLGDVPDLQEWKGDRFLAELRAFKLRLSNKAFASGIRIHQNEILDDRLGLVQPKIQQLAMKARSFWRRLMTKLLINGFDGTAYPDVGNGLAPDGLFFFSTSRASGSNKLTLPLTAANLVTAETMLQSQMSYDLLEPLDIMGTHLIVGPALLPTAQKLMLSEYLPSAGGGPTETNYLKGRYQIINSPLLRGTYANYWFVVDLKEPIKPLIHQERQGIITSAVTGERGGTSDSIPRFQRGELWFGAECRGNVGYIEPRLIVGSQV